MNKIAPGSISGTQTYQIECNRGNSLIDFNTNDSQNGKWTTKTDFNLKRGDRVSVASIMIEATGAGSGTQTIEFSGDNVIFGTEKQNWTDDSIVLEFGFYIVNNGQRTINLPIQFPWNNY